MAGPWWFSPAPGRRLSAVRVLVFGYAAAWLVGFSPVVLSVLWFPPERFQPVGVVSLLEAPLAPALGVFVWLATVVAVAAALVGARYRVSGPMGALGLLWIASYRSSWGMIFHTENLVVVHALILACLPASDAWSLDARRDPRMRARGELRHARYGWGLRLMAAITALTYALAGVAKLRHAGLAWLDGEALLSHVAWDNLRKIELGDLHSPIGAWLCGFPAVFAPLAWASMILELGAPLALFGRWPARLWAAGMWAFHVGVLAIMAIAFPYALTGIAFAPFFAVERPLSALASAACRRAGRRSGR
jgi:hypothetical protein